MKDDAVTLLIFLWKWYKLPQMSEKCSCENDMGQGTSAHDQGHVTVFSILEPHYTLKCVKLDIS